MTHLVDRAAPDGWLSRLSRIRYRGRRVDWQAYLFILPFALIFIVITLLPIFFGIYISFNEWGIVGDPEWVGLDNFREAMQDDWIPKVWGNTFQMAALVVPGTVIVALLMALWINREQWFSGPIRTAFFAPHVVAITVTAIIWIWIFEKETGLLNLALYGVGIPKQGWLTTSKWVIQSISLVTIWQAVGFHMVILLAGLKEIPAELGEAAVIDGASAWQAFWRITLPLLTPALGLVITLEIISAFRIFGQVYLMTGGGPGGHSATIVSYIYHEGFVRFRLGFAAALSLLLFLTILLFTLLRARLVREHSN